MASTSLTPASSPRSSWGRRRQTSAATSAALENSKKVCESSFETFEAALQEYDPKLLARFRKLCRSKVPGLGDLVTTVDEIVDASTNGHPTNNRTFATRFIKVLERVKEFAAIGDVFVGGAQNMIVSAVWGRSDLRSRFANTIIQI